MSGALDILASLILDDGRRWGEAATPEQWADATSVLSGHRRRHWISRSRGYAKTSDVAGMTLAAMLTLLPPGARCYAAAADRDQARLLRDSIQGFVARTAELHGACDVQAFRVVASTGVELEVLAADSSSAYGLRPAWLVVDELCQWPTTPNARDFWQAITTALPKMADATLVVITTAGSPEHWSRRVFDLAGSDSMWNVHETRGPAPWIGRDLIEAERRRLAPSVFARLFDNVWTAAEDRLTNLDDLRACVTLSGPLAPVAGVRYVVACDLGVSHDRTVAAVCHATPDGAEGVRIVADRMQVWAGSHSRPVRLGGVEDFLAQASATFNHAHVVLDPWQAVGMAQRLRSRGVRCEEFTFSSASVGRLAATLHLLLRTRALALPDDPELLDELANVRLRETSPGVLRMDHDPDRHDDRAIALALAAQRLLDAPPARPRLRYHPPATHDPDAAMQAPSVQGPDEARMRAWTNG